jgi:TonB-dependent receptor
VAAAIELAFCGFARAQDAAPAPAAGASAAAAGDAVQSVVVTGTRASLAKSLELKRNAAIVQDSISATELGRFPDDNVADSLSHINGISITRTTGGEGQYIGVRGLGPGYNIVTLNDRILATDGDGRDFAFDVLPSDVISGADVQKSPQASQIEGGIGGIVNLRSARPFDARGFHAALRVEGDRNDMSRLTGRKASGFVTDTTADGKFGLLLGAVLSVSNVRTDSMGYNTYDPDNPGSFDLNGDGTLSADEQNLVGSCCIAFGSTFEKKKRTAFSGAFEWRPSDDVRMTVDALATHLDSPQVGYNEAYYVQWVPGRWSNVTARDGLITGMTVNSFVPEIANITIARAVDTNQVGWNGEWKVSPALTLSGDVYQSRSIRDEGGKDNFVVSGIAGDNTLKWSANDNALPDIDVTLQDGRDLAAALAAGQLGDADYGLHYVGLSGTNVHDTVRGGTLAGRFLVDRAFVDSLDFGVSRTNRTKVRESVGNDQTGGSCQYCDMYGTTFASLGQHVVSPLTVPHFMQGAGGRYPTTFMRFDVPAYFAALRTLDGTPKPDGSGNFDFAATLPVADPTNSYDVRERTTAAWLQANLGADGWSANVGVRLVRTTTSATTAIAPIVAIDDPTPEVPTSSPDVTYGPATPVTSTASYFKALPSANVTWELSKTLQLRVAASKAMSRPSLDQLAPTQTDTAIDRVYTITVAGNSKLKPTDATQADLSLEWYYKPKSAFTVGLFGKHITNFVTSNTATDVDTGVPNNSTDANAGKPDYLFTVISPINGDRANVMGLELGWQHLFDNGFGFRGQYTRNSSKSWIMGQYVGQLDGVAPATSSLGLLYEKGGVSASLSFDHTGGYVVSHSTEIPGWANVAKPMTWVTASASYELTDHLKLYVEGKNLSDAVYRSNLGRSDAAYGFSSWGRTVTVGASLKL